METTLADKPDPGLDRDVDSLVLSRLLKIHECYPWVGTDHEMKLTSLILDDEAVQALIEALKKATKQ